MNCDHFSQDLFRHYWSIDFGHRVATRDQIPLRSGVYLLEYPVDEEPAIAGEEYDIAHQSLFE
jgi:hypothetical protein